MFIPVISISQPSSVNVIDIAGGFTSPVSITNAGDGSNRLFVTEQGGTIKIVDNGIHISTAFLDVSSLTTSGGEQGLLGLAFHPDYETNGFFYINYTDQNGDTVIDRYSVSTNTNSANVASRQQVLAFEQPNRSHNGGDLHFGPEDGYLYISTGDGGDAGEAQNLDSLLGNILRVDVDSDGFPGDSSKNYSIPNDNPYVGIAGADEIWVSGLRNPWRFSLDRDTGDLYIGDVGEDAFEEFNYIASTSSGGENFGWPCYEGNMNLNTSGCGSMNEFTFPFFDIAHVQAGGGPCSAIGGFVYRGSTYSDFNGWYFHTDWCSGEFFVSRPVNTGGWQTHSLGTLIGGFAVTGFGESESGELFVVAWDGLLQIVGVDEIFANGFESF